ncbi:efflux RND transporter permease subunit [Teredinibacter sp. KSP-S5-2]|uniref:efflux RND transporter permease subunit n=1 Tax=Teredinibacter sp. KSP-S5-2 TaxID=3034506 RepID=UPI00293531C1|nr:MMPL family transporter [Teredinibacter sp. KSP-S5-2]WNO07514.1 MMPL family transporter [Teredinibacter sp. KSP-S5-2]
MKEDDISQVSPRHSKQDRLIDYYAQFLIRYRWLVILLSLIASFALISGLKHFGFNQEYRVFFSEDNPHLQAFDQQQKTYAKNDNIIFIITPKEGVDVFDPQVLAAVEDATAQAWLLPYAPRVDSVTKFQHTSAEGDDLVVEDLVENAASLTPEELSEKKQIALNDPFVVGQLVNEDASVTALNITFQMPETDPQVELPHLVQEIRTLKADIEAKYPVEVRLSGVVMLSNAFFESSMQDQQTLVPLMYLAIIIIAFVLLRSIGATIATLLVVFLSMLAALGGFFYVGGLMTPPSAAATTIITTLAVADSIHILVTMFSGMRKGMSRHDAIRYSLRLNFGPVLLTSVTTGVGFLSMNLSDTPPFNDLGNITAFGVTVAFVLSVTLLPSLMAVIPVKANTSEGAFSVWMHRFAEYVIEKRKGIFLLSVVIAVSAVFGISHNTFEDDFIGYFDKSVEFRRDADYLDEKLTGIYQVSYSLETGEDYGVSDPQFLQQVESFVQWFRQQPKVAHVNTYTDTFKRLNKNMHGDSERYYALPDDKELAAQYLLLYELSLPEGMDLNNQMDIGRSSTRVNVTLHNMTSTELTAISELGSKWLEENTQLKAYGVGPSVMFAYISDTNMKSMFLSTLVAILIISLLITLSLRNLRLGLISLIPNVLPLAIAFGVWGYTVGEVNVGVSMVMGMALGIIVDDTVHFLSKYLRARREEGLDSQDAVRYAFSSVGVAIVVTSIILIAGFSVLAQSSFGMNSGMAKLTSISILVALIADFLLLPVLLLKLDAKEYANVKKPAASDAKPVNEINDDDDEFNPDTTENVYV